MERVRILHYADAIGFEEDKEVIPDIIRSFPFKKSYKLIIESTDNEEMVEEAYKYDFVLIDYGGLSVSQSGSLMEDLQRYILGIVEKTPSTIFIFISNVPDFFMEEAKEEFDLANIEFYRIRNLEKYFKSNGYLV